MASDSTFRSRFGDVGHALAAALPQFSLDVVGVVSSYLVCGVAKAGTVPKLLFSFPVSVAGEKTYDNCDALAVSPADNNVWCSVTNGVLLFTSEGQFLRRAAPDQLKTGCACTAFHNDLAFVLITDQGEKVVVCTLNGDYVRDFAAGQLRRPWGITIADELAIIADQNNARIMIFKLDGTLVRQFGAHGQDVGFFVSPCGVGVSPTTGHIWVVDAGNNRLQIFDKEGKFQRVIARQGSNIRDLHNPLGIAFNRAGQVLIGDDMNHRVVVLEQNGDFVTAFGSKSEDSEGELERPWGVCVDREGRILVGDHTARVHVYAFPSD